MDLYCSLNAEVCRVDAITVHGGGEVSEELGVNGGDAFVRDQWLMVFRAG